MDVKEILSRCDHTLLAQSAAWPQIKTLCDEARDHQTACACIPPAFVRRAADYVGNTLKLCTVIGFPNGYSTTAVKVFETEDAIRGGADEIDMVANLGMVKEGRWEELLTELKAVKASCGGRILKVIAETCFLTEGEKIRLCDLVSRSGAEYIKTSTGFGGGGATLEDVALFRAHADRRVKIKAAGGIRSLEVAEAFLRAGADRLGASALVGLAKQRPELFR
ncbi:MAG: deoxyribose-phosphate aldolase [Clostridiales bacterium]|nr:deoxyribose-phosphate aldolase [Clostridiales bacterium]